MLIYSIVVTYNGAKWVEKCFDSLINSIYKTKILAIDNYSTDNTLDLIRKLFPQVDVIETGNNLGFGKANNIGLKIALELGADYVFLLNQDAWIEPNTIKNLIDFQNANNQFGIVSPIQLNGNGDKLDNNFAKYISLKNISEINQSIEQKILFEEANFANAAAWLISLNCLNKVGGFDPLFLHYGEDRDYCNRALYLGFKIGILYNVNIFHDRMFQKNNLYRNERNLLYTSELAHIKNINNKLVYNYFTLIISRIQKIFKYIILFKFKKIIMEIGILYKIVLITKDVKKSRLYCCTSINPFLTK